MIAISRFSRYGNTSKEIHERIHFHSVLTCRRCSVILSSHRCCLIHFSILLSNDCLFPQFLTHFDTHFRHLLLSPHTLSKQLPTSFSPLFKHIAPHSLSSSPLTLSTIHSTRNSPISNKHTHSTHIQLRIVDDPQHLLFVLHITSQSHPTHDLHHTSR